ncbi:MAG TPA: hypothetical protein VH370_25100, partial [Humisphaera sp.]|nr:hypothetical protein [Humisphaera sp.]
GCEPTHPNEVPGNANMVAEGDRNLVYTTPSRGMVYIYDTNTKRLVWAGEVDGGRQIEVDRHNNKVMVNGNLVVTKLQPYGQDQIYFQPSGNNSLVNPPPPQPAPQPQPAPGSVTISPNLSVAPTTQPSPSQNPQQ